MRFVDQVRILVRAGNGGKGHVGWRREKFVPYGGPAGGDGGRGGDVVFVADDHLTTLLDLRYQQHYLAESGLPGRNKGQYGRNGEDRRIRVPVGTMVFLEGVAGEPGERPPWAVDRPPRDLGGDGDEGGMEMIYVVEDVDGAEYIAGEEDADEEAAPGAEEGADEADPEDSSDTEDEADPEDSSDAAREADPGDSSDAEVEGEAGPEDGADVDADPEDISEADAEGDADAPPLVKREKPARRGRGRRRPEPEPLLPGALLVDLVEQGQEVRIARGGRGGRGNIHFRTATNRAPYYAEPGSPGEAFWLRLELKLLADVGIVGFPNVGKSTLIRAISRARPKVGNYPFTTLVPQLGVVSLSGERSMVVADVPGLIRGASEGKGLGLDFLRHLERTRVLLHLLSPDPEEGREPLADLEALEEELLAYGPIFSGRPRVVALNKIDTPEGERLVRATRAALRRREIPLFPISAATGAGIPELLEALWRRVELGRPKRASEAPAAEASQPR